MKQPSYPAAGQGISAAWARELVDFVRSLTPRPSPDLLVSHTPAGVSYTRPQALSNSPVIPGQPWAIHIKGLTADFRRCGYRRGPVTKVLADITAAALPTDGTECWVGASVDTEDGTATILTGSAWTDVCDQAEPAPADSRYIRMLLYRLVRPSAESAEWSVADNWALMPDLTLHI